MDTKLVYVRLHVTKFGILNTVRSIYFSDHNIAQILENKKIGAIFNFQILDQFKVHVHLVETIHNVKQTDEKS